MGYGLLKVVGTKPQVMTMGVIDLRKYGDHYLKLRRIFERVVGIIEAYLPDELAIEAPFFGKNVQSMLKLAISEVLLRRFPQEGTAYAGKRRSRGTHHTCKDP